MSAQRVTITELVRRRDRAGIPQYEIRTDVESFLTQLNAQAAQHLATNVQVGGVVDLVFNEAGRVIHIEALASSSAIWDLDPGRWYILRCTADGGRGEGFDFRDQFVERAGHTYVFKHHRVNAAVTRIEEATPVSSGEGY